MTREMTRLWKQVQQCTGLLSLVVVSRCTQLPTRAPAGRRIPCCYLHELLPAHTFITVVCLAGPEAV